MKKHLKKIDRIRLFSCLAVLFYHMGILPGGYLAVCSFFVLSGFLSARSLLSEKKMSLKNYYLHRFVRIYLPMAVFALGTAAFFSFFPEIRWFTVKKEVLSVLFSSNNFYQIRSGSDYFARSSSTPLLHLWYLSLLFQYDLILPPLLLLLKKTGKISKAVPFLTLILMITGSFLLFLAHLHRGAVNLAYYGSFSRSYSFLSGVLLAYFQMVYKPFGITERKGEVLFHLYFLILFLFFCFVRPSSKFFGVMMLLTGILTMRQIDHAVLDRTHPGKADHVLRLLAGWTYGIYLFHYPLWFFFRNMDISPILSIPLTLMISLVMTAILKIPFTRKRKEAGRLIQLALSLFLFVTGIYGGIQVLKTEDYSEEMKELEEKLAENRKLIEERNAEIIRNEEEERKAYEALFDSGKSDEEAAAEWVAGLPVVGIGDSIMLDAVKTLYGYFPEGYFDCEISRSLYYGEKVLTQLKEEGKLSEPIVLCLGTNGDFSKKRSEELLDIVEGREVFWINAVGADDPSYNRKFEDFAKDHPNIHIIHWEEISKGHPEYFYYDGIHVVGDGVKAFSKAVYDAVYERYLVKYREEREKMKNGMIEEAEARIVFYGNDALVSVYPELSAEYGDAVFHTDVEDYDDLYKRIEEEKKNTGLSGRVVFVFDRSAGIKENNYKKLNHLCDGEIIVVSLERGLSIEEDGIRTIDFYEEIKENPDYLIGDKIHLSKEGARALTEKILQSIQ